MFTKKSEKTYHIEAIHFDFNPRIEPEIKVYNEVHYDNLDYAYAAAKLLAFEEAQELNEACRSENGANARWFDVDEDYEETGYDYVTRCWDGDDYRCVSKYKVMAD